MIYIGTITAISLVIYLIIKSFIKSNYESVSFFQFSSEFLISILCLLLLVLSIERIYIETNIKDVKFEILNESKPIIIIDKEPFHISQDDTFNLNNGEVKIKLIEGTNVFSFPISKYVLVQNNERFNIYTIYRKR